MRPRTRKAPAGGAFRRTPGARSVDLAHRVARLVARVAVAGRGRQLLDQGLLGEAAHVEVALRRLDGLGLPVGARLVDGERRLSPRVSVARRGRQLLDQALLREPR